MSKYRIEDYNRGFTTVEADSMTEAWEKYKEEQGLNNTYRENTPSDPDDPTDLKVHREYFTWHDEYNGGHWNNRVWIDKVEQ